jgi:hypothetical protein
MDDFCSRSPIYGALLGLEGTAVPIDGKPYGLKHWEKGVPPQTLKNAIPAAAEVLKKL